MVAKTDKKILYCDIDSTINNHWVRIRKWTIPNFPGDEIHWKAFTRRELMKDLPLPDAKESINFFSNKYEINFLTARGFNGSNRYRLISENWYKYFFGHIVFRLNNFLSVRILKLRESKISNKNKYAYGITRDWLDLHNFVYNSLIVVDSIEQKIDFLKSNPCDLFIDDLSWGQNFVGSYVNLYNSAIDDLNQNKVSYEVFNAKSNNWKHLVKRYLD